MRKNIERSIIVNTVHTKSVNDKMEVIENPTFEVYGKIPEKQIEKIASEKYGNLTRVLKVDTIENRYIISVENFIKNAKLIEE